MYQLDRHLADVSAAAAEPAPRAPGKRTHTSRLQAKGTGAHQAVALPAPGAGAPLPATTAQAAGAALGHDVSTVRVHTDGQADALGARAFACGDDVHFAAGAYDPGSAAGQALIGHELAHVVQQRDGRVAGEATAGATPVNADPALEAEADRQGDAVAGVIQGFDLDRFLDGPFARPAPAIARPVVQGADLAPGDDRDHDGQADDVTVEVRQCLGVCRPAGPSAANHWGLPEPLLVKLGADLPLVDVAPGATSIKLATPYGSSSLDSTGAFKINVKDGPLTVGTDGQKVEAGGKAGPVSGSVDSDGKVSGAVEVGPFKLGADSTGKATFTAAGVAMTYDAATGAIATTFTPQLSWGPATFKGALAPGGVKVTLELKLELCKDWSLTIAQDYTFKRTITTDQAQRALIETLVDPFFEYVNGGAGSYSDLLEALGRTY